jgi:hypothetical protein
MDKRLAKFMALLPKEATTASSTLCSMWIEATLALGACPMFDKPSTYNCYGCEFRGCARYIHTEDPALEQGYVA